ATADRSTHQIAGSRCPAAMPPDTRDAYLTTRIDWRSSRLRAGSHHTSAGRPAGARRQRPLAR
ncbi:MAG TPA: hypothetical protein PLE12_10790, partial [Propionicimonas sp.]|nr:hypothetical protein [Propionicimonas sp.]